MLTTKSKGLAPDFANQICKLQDQYTASWHQDGKIEILTPLWLLVAQQHKHNFDLWHKEDLARVPAATDAEIAAVKRNIDSLNQQRNDVIAELDVYLSDHCFAPCEDSKRPWNSETIGSIVDRLSIASLKIYHMREESIRANASQDHHNTCAAKLDLMGNQRADLVTALQLLVNDINAGQKQHKIYHQFKMYNDPTMNPSIYTEAEKD